jgi:hypothetical protein
MKKILLLAVSFWAALLAAIPPPSVADTSPPLASNFVALRELDNAQQLVVPPDINGAVGPQHLVTTTNSAIRIQDRTGKELLTVPQTTFWQQFNLTQGQGLGGPRITDPNVVYDPYGQRFITTMIAITNTTVQGQVRPVWSLLVGVSLTSDPTAGWKLYNTVVRDPNTVELVNFLDYPQVGFNGKWIVVNVAAVLASSGAVYGYTYVIDKAYAYAGNPLSYTVFKSRTTTNIPARTYDSQAGPLYLCKTAFVCDKLDGGVGNETLTPGVVQVTSPLSYYGNQTFSHPNPGVSVKIDSGGTTMRSVVYRNGYLWLAHTAYVQDGISTTNPPLRSVIEWWQVDPATSGVIQYGVIEDPTNVISYDFPSLAVNARNDVLIGYNTFSNNQYPSANYSFRAAGDPPGTMRQSALLKAGEAPYNDYFLQFHPNEIRWGDFSSATVDPVNDLDLWTTQEYASIDDGYWSTWWGRLLAPPSLLTLTGFTPTKAVVGSLVTLTGTHMSAATGVAFNGVNAPNWQHVSDTQLTVYVPSGATSGKVTVSAADGVATSFSDFTVSQISSFSPTTGPVGTTRVTINGAGFGGVTQVAFNGTPSTVWWREVVGSQIGAFVPVGASTGKVTITTPSGVLTSTSDFVVTGISYFSPIKGPVETWVTINGAGFSGATQVAFNGIPSTAWRVISGQVITASVPVGATTGKVAVTTPSGVFTSYDNFVVTGLPPTITSFSPTMALPGESIFIGGTSFTNVTQVTFNGRAATFRVWDDFTISAVVPNASTGKVTITTPKYTVTSATDFIEITLPVTITGFNNNPVKPSYAVQITGTNLRWTTAVLFKGANGQDVASPWISVDTNIIYAIVPYSPVPAVTGVVKVVTGYPAPYDTVVSPTALTVLPYP